MTPLREWSARGGAAAAALLFLVLLASILQVDQIPAFVSIALIGLCALSIFRPDAALYVVACGVPIAAWLGRHVNGSVSWPETLAVAFCAGYCARGSRQRTRERDSLDAPILLAAALVAASLAVQFFIDAWRFGGGPIRADLSELLTSRYFVSAASFDPVDAAMRLLESLVLLRAAASASREDARTGPRLIAWIVCGASAAALLNLLRLWVSADRVEAAVAEFVRILMTERVNVHYGDVNAAGSYFVMTFLAAIGLALRPRGLPWLIAALLVGSSVWITGSRTAVMAGLLAMTVPAGAIVWRLGPSSVRRTTLAAAGLTFALLSAVAAYSIPERGNQQSVSSAAHVRWELARTSFRMTAVSPSFGVGIGRFYSRSGEFSSPELLRAFPPAIHENAHNNFLQILAELGIVGLIVLVWLLLAAARLCVQLLRADERDPLRWAAVTGLFAFVLSWLGGHPLLIDEPAFTFWLLLGAVSGWGSAAGGAHPAGRSSWIAGSLAIVVLLSVPVRVDRQRADFNLEHRGVGLSAWQDAIDGVRYRLAGPKSSVFVPSDAQVVVVPLRAVKSAPEIRLELLFDGRPADVVDISSERWHILRLRLPQDRNAPRFRRLDLRVTGTSSAETEMVMVGKVEARQSSVDSR
jgi:hypothetical protein